MDRIKDQRDVEARNPDAAPGEVESSWGTISDQIKRLHGGTFPNSDRAEFEEDNTTEAVAYVNDNRWVADCPGDNCNAGMMVWQGNPKAACFDCGRIWTVVFPGDAVEGEEVLLERPPGHRYWRPDKETVDDLKVENLLHGYRPGGSR